MRIAPEGIRLLLPPLSFLLLVLLGSLILGIPILPTVTVGIAVFVLILFLFFRDPKRRTPKAEGLVLSPCDGRVILTTEMKGDQDTGRIAIFMSVLNVHVNRSPVTGVIQEVRRRRGRFYHAASSDAACKNTSVTTKATAEFGEVMWIQVAGALARKISCRLQEGQQIEAGQRFGLIYFGSRLEVIMPPNIRIRVKPGERVRAGETILGEVRSSCDIE